MTTDDGRENVRDRPSASRDGAARDGATNGGGARDDDGARATSSSQSSASARAPTIRTETMEMNNGTTRIITVDTRFSCAKCARGSSCWDVHRATNGIAAMRSERRYNEKRKAAKARGGRREVALTNRVGVSPNASASAPRVRAEADPLGAVARLTADGHRPTLKTFTAVIATLGAQGRANECENVLREIETYGGTCDVAVWNAVAHAYCASGDPSGAEAVVDRMVGEEGVGVNSATHPEIIYTYAKRGETKLVYRLLRRMAQVHNFIADEKAYNAFLRGLCERDDVEEAEEVLRRWNNEKFDLERQSDRGGFVSKPTAASYGLAIDAWVRRGDMLRARKLLQQMQWERVPPSLYVFNMLIDGYLRTENIAAAEGIFRELESSGTWDMESLGIRPDNVSYTLFLDYWASQGQVDACERIFKRMKRKGVEPDVVAYGAMVKAYARARDADAAEDVLTQCKDAGVKPSVAIYSAVIAAFCTLGDMNRARSILDRMFDDGLRPNERTFAHFAWGYGQLEDINGIMEVATAMVASGLKLKGASRNAIIRACQECGMRMTAIEALLDRVDPLAQESRKGKWSRNSPKTPSASRDDAGARVPPRSTESQAVEKAAKPMAKVRFSGEPEESFDESFDESYDESFNEYVPAAARQMSRALPSTRFTKRAFATRTPLVRHPQRFILSLPALARSRVALM